MLRGSTGLSVASCSVDWPGPRPLCSEPFSFCCPCCPPLLRTRPRCTSRRLSDLFPHLLRRCCAGLRDLLVVGSRDAALLDVDLRDVDLRDVDLRDIDPLDFDLCDVDLLDIDLRDVDLRDSDL